MIPLPKTVTLYKKTPEFNQDTIPAGLLKSHATKANTWAKIIILEGQLIYRIFKADTKQYQLNQHQHGVIEPEIPHEIEPKGNVRLYIEFYK